MRGGNYVAALRPRRLKIRTGFWRIMLISTAESALAGIAAPVPVGLALELGRRRTGPQWSGRAGGTFPPERNVPDNN